LLCPGGVGRQKSTILLALPLMFLGRWGRTKLRSFVLGDAMQDTPGMKEMSEFASLVFTSFRPRRGKLPVFSDTKLRGLTMPLLAIAGGRDVLLDSRQTARRLKRAVPKADIRFLPNTGHLIRGQTAAVLEFLMRA
jgi:pimeloyl-ACP methyl ester carboxylesterase